MRTAVLFAILSAMLGCSGGDGPSAPPDIFAIVQDQVIAPQGWSDQVVRIYGTDMPLQPGQTVGPALDINGNDVAPLTITEPTWFFWADTTPFQLFSHPTVFVYMNEDGSNLRVEQQEWFPVIDGLVFMPDVPIWGPADITTGGTGGTMAPVRTMAGQPCGEAHAVVVQGWGHPWIGGTIDKLIASLSARGYIVHPVRHSDMLNPAGVRALLLSELAALTMGERKSQIDIFYIGHGSRQGEWVFGASGQSLARVTGSQLIDALGDAATPRVNIVVDSCHAAAFANTAPTIADHVATTMAADTFIHVLASTSTTESANVPSAAAGVVYTERLIPQLAMEPAGKPFEYGDATMPSFTVDTRDAAGVTRTVRQSPPTPVTTSPSAPLLFYDRAYDECQVVADLPENEFNERRVTIRGAGFGDVPGMVELFPWAARDIPGTGVPLPIFIWSDQTIVVQVPMRSKGFPGDPSNLATYVEGLTTWGDPGSYYVGNYFVRVATAGGQWSALYNDRSAAPGVAQEHFYAPQLIHIAAQVRSVTHTPSYVGLPDGIEFIELWLQMTASSPELGIATVLMSDVSVGTDPKPPWAVGALSGTYILQSSNVSHTTSAAALARHMGLWAYDLSAAERDLMTAMHTGMPMVNFWGFRMQFASLTAGPPMTDYLRDTGDWEFLLIYD